MNATLVRYAGALALAATLASGSAVAQSLTGAGAYTVGPLLLRS